MVIVGLTGSIGMGKSTAAKRFAAHGIPVFDADAEVHRLYGGEGAVLVEKAFPGTVVEGGVDRVRLARRVVGDAAALKRLEAIVHPLVRRAARDFLAGNAAARARMAVLEVPLLFETGLDGWVDATVVLTAPPDVQRHRVLRRPGMSAEKLDGLLGMQLPDSEKRKRGDFVVDTSGPIEATGLEIDRIVESLQTREGKAIRRWLDAQGAGAGRAN